MGPRIVLGHGEWPLWRRALPLPDGALWWLGTEDPDGPSSATLAEMLELAQEFGRMGLFQRDLRSGEGHWDPHVFRIYGVDPARGTPHFSEGARFVHPDDRSVFEPAHRAVMSSTGRHGVRFRIVRPDGDVRHLHSLSEVRNGPDGRPARMVGVLIDDTEIVERERAQREASERLATALQMAGVSVWRIDLATQRVHYDERTVTLIGLPSNPHGIPAGEVREFVHPDDREANALAAEEAVRSDRMVDVIARYRRLDGGWRTMLTRRVAQRDAEGRAIGVLGVALDITELVAEREQARRLQERTQALAAALGLGLWSREVDSGVAEWNEQMYGLYGRAPVDGPPSVDEWLERHVHPQDRERMTRDMHAGDDCWTPNYHAEFRIQRNDGQTRWVYCWARRETHEGRRLSYGVHLDVTERRSAELELQRERERAKFAMDAAGVGIWERNLTGGPSYWNEHMYRLRGLDPADPRPIEELAWVANDPDNAVRLDAMREAHIAHGTPYEGEQRLIWPDGTVRWVATRGRVVRDADGRPLVMAGINIDITERKQAERLWLDKQRIEQASRAKSEFMARVSHELRTPMNAVLGFTQLLAQDRNEAPTPRQRERLAHIEVAGRHLLALIDDVLDLASIEADDKPLASEPVPLAAVVRDAAQWVASLSARHGVSLSVDGDGLRGAVLADRRRLGQILINLLTNAVKYNRAGGWVRVESRLRERAGASEWGLAVRDSGRGLTREQMQRVFEPFNRLGAEQEDIQGTGIGLTIVRQLSERMGGSVEVDSEPGVGSEFRVWLPAAPHGAIDAQPAVGEPSTGAAAPAVAASEAPLSLLCVEDNLVNMTLVREVVALRPAVRLSCAETGAQGIAVALRERPDVVLLDLQLPDMHGLEVMRRLRAEPDCMSSTIIALSANAMPDDVRAGLAAGFDAYWTKPIDFTGFLSGLDALAQRKSSERVNQ
jgi:PAS domain S-box-containing protein